MRRLNTFTLPAFGLILALGTSPLQAASGHGGHGGHG